MSSIQYGGTETFLSGEIFLSGGIETFLHKKLPDIFGQNN